MHSLEQIFNDAFLFAMVLQAAPIFLAALGGAFTHHASIFNIALDGMMLMGAFAAISVGGATHSVWLAVLASMAMGVGMAVIFGGAVLWAKADVVVAGIGIGLMAAGLSLLLLETIYHSESNYTPNHMPKLPRIRLGPLVHVPILGPAFDGQTILVAVAAVLVPLAWWVLYRTPLGIHVRSVGEHEDAAVAAGIHSGRVKMYTVLIAGALSGLAGAQLAMATLDSFVTNMTAGRGFIAVAAVFVGRGRPLGVAIACLAFGFAGALADQLQLEHLPSNLVLMLPYAITVAVLLARPLIAALGRRRAVA
jgi:general nucleoside transport system permease protein